MQAQRPDTPSSCETFTARRRTESTLLSVIGVDTRLLEPLRRGSLRGRESVNAQGAREFTGSWVPKSMLFLALVFMKHLVRFGVPFGVPF